MKIILSIATALFLGHTSTAQTYAVNTTPIDCQGASHNIFSNLDAGKIIVIGWTMPCSSCAPSLLNAHNAVLNFAISNPGLVEFWLADDYANTNCASVESWGTTNGMNNSTFFSTTQLDMRDYGSEGMPKVVVIGCSSHKVYFNTINPVTESDVTTAINSAFSDMTAGCQVAGINELSENKLGLSCYPNPTNSIINISLSTEIKDDFTLGIYSTSGVLMQDIVIDHFGSNANEIQMSVKDLSEGIYFLKASNGELSETQKFQIKR
ncbi:MAG: T9SS type A sorting domain-containing protein [Crocinitomicaceae bacterium]